MTENQLRCSLLEDTSHLRPFCGVRGERRERAAVACQGRDSLPPEAPQRERGGLAPQLLAQVAPIAGGDITRASQEESYTVH
eukprot:247440-Pyramimonas_sp.AAC.1